MRGKEEEKRVRERKRKRESEGKGRGMLREIDRMGEGKRRERGIYEGRERER